MSLRIMASMGLSLPLRSEAISKPCFMTLQTRSLLEVPERRYRSHLQGKVSIGP